ncbi:uncharacterized protein LOC141914175 [Tubulanus polymorphus]|uniref:uncharacterized protein LOC141914175 n=1 Tax=Tubulanus polymorphus TaxID=672921 RepID=UPI003DA408B0
MATSNPDRFEISVPFKGRRVTVWSDQDNEYRTIQNYFYQPLFKLESDRITADGNILQLDITLWCEELEAAIEQKLKTIYTGHVIAVQMMPFDEVKLEWRDAPSGVEIPNHPIPFNHQPQNHVFIVKCENEEMCEIYKSRLQQSPQSIGSGLVIGASRHGNEYVFRVNTVPISEARTVQPDIDQRHHSQIDNVKLFHDNLENQFSQLKCTVEERLNRFNTEQQLEERLNRFCTEQQLEERLNRFCTEQQLEERLNRCCTEQQLEERLNRCYSNGHLFVLVEKNEKFFLRKYKDQDKVLEEDVTDIVSGCGTLVIRGNNIYIQLDRDVRVLRLLENPDLFME